MSIEVGSVIEGVVTGITHFGAFVELPNGQTGLVHISEVANSYVKDINEHLKKKDTVKVKVLSVEKDGKIGLSIKQSAPNATPPPAAARARKSPQRPQQRRGVPKLNFEDKLAKFLKESDEKQQDLRKNTESKRGGRGGLKNDLV